MQGKLLPIFAVALAVAACSDSAVLEPRKPGHPSFAPQFALESSPASTALTASLSPAATFSFTSLAHGMSFAHGVNDAGLVVGDFGGNNIATVWTEAGGFQTIGRLDGTTNCCSSLVDVNTSGDGIGFSALVDGSAAIMSWSQATNTKVNLQGPGRPFGHGINDNGDVVGTDYAGVSGFARPFFKANGGSYVVLSVPAPYVSGDAFEINNAGVIVGAGLVSNEIWHAVAWTRYDAAPMHLGSLGGNKGWANDVNDAGDIVGWSEIPSGERHAFLWTSSSGMIDLNAWPNSCAGPSEAFAINQAGVIVGKCGGRPVLWTATEGMRALLLPSGVTTGDARAINGKNVIAGSFSGFGAALWKLANSPPSASPGGPYAGDEGSPITFKFSASDPDGDALTYAWNFGDATTGNGPVPPTHHTYADDGTYPVTLTVTDGKGGSDTKSTTVAVANVAPAVGPVTAPLDPVSVNTSVSISADFTDAGVLDGHSVVIDWDANGTSTTSAGSVTKSNGAGTATGSHTYTAAGVYTVKVTVSDDDGGSASSVFQYVVVYDPDAGFVTGGGWIESPAGAYAADPTLAGKASFGFVSRYKSGATTPSGATQFQFRAGSLDFHSASYEWLVVSGPKAQYKGSGTVNGAGDYGFILTANDGQADGGGGTDRFRIKIWNKATGAVVYDNQLGDADDASATTVIGGGSITIHK